MTADMCFVFGFFVGCLYNSSQNKCYLIPYIVCQADKKLDSCLERVQLQQGQFRTDEGDVSSTVLVPFKDEKPAPLKDVIDQEPAPGKDVVDVVDQNSVLPGLPESVSGSW